jgi:NADP-dependent 3-hydroxy acid dehydrogenase YdfG
MKQTVLITGCSSGFGKLTAKHLAQKGHNVIATMRHTGTTNKKIKEELEDFAKQNGLTLLVQEIDVTDDNTIKKAILNIEQYYPSIDVLINNAGYGIFGLQEAISISDAQAVFDTNFFGILRMNKAVLPIMRKNKKGLIINLSSVAGRTSWPFGGLYSATKYAVEAISESLKIELSPLGIDCVTIEPGAYADTDFNSSMKVVGETEVLATYGAAADAPLKAIANFSTSITNPSDSLEIAQLIEEVINTPFGQRKYRYPKGNVAELIQQLNHESQTIQQQTGFEKMIYSLM